jgi:hypothetical protein
MATVNQAAVPALNDQEYLCSETTFVAGVASFVNRSG